MTTLREDFLVLIGWTHKPSKLGLEETGKSIGETQAQAKKPEPEKVEPPKQPTSTLQPPQKIYVEGSPKQRTNGILQMISNE